jgi:hypothetical protein
LVLSRPPASNRRAAISREQRQRQRDGVRCYQVPVHHRVVEALLARGLTEEEAHDPKKVARELGIVLMQWSERWL